MITVLENIEDMQASDAPLCVTHGGVFHADEVLATAILERAFERVRVLRVAAVPEGLPADAIVYDIGFGALDHHQLEGAGARENGVPYASAGLVWREYGQAALAGIEAADEVWPQVDARLIQGVDAVDCGFVPKSAGRGVMSLSQVVSGFNPAWGSGVSSDQGFASAVAVVRQVLDNAIAAAQANLRAAEVVDQAIEQAKEGVMVLPDFLPWHERFFAAEREKTDGIKFVVYPSVRGGYNWQTVSKTAKSRVARKEVPTEWRGLEGDALRAACGVSDAIFCHRAGFVGGAQSLAGALAMVRD